MKQATGGAQQPWVSSSPIAGEFFFAGRGETAPPAATPLPAPVNPAQAAWTAVQDSDSVAVLEAFLKQFPKGIYAELAKARLRKLKETKVAVGIFPKPATEPKPGKEFQDCDTCPKMVVLPAGSFTMGSPKSEKSRHDHEGPRYEGPQRTVTIAKPFAVGKFEVTFEEWDSCVSDGGCNGHRPKDRGWGRDRRPVIYVNWDNAKTYVSWLSRKGAAFCCLYYLLNVNIIIAKIKESE